LGSLVLHSGLTLQLLVIQQGRHLLYINISITNAYFCTTDYKSSKSIPNSLVILYHYFLFLFIHHIIHLYILVLLQFIIILISSLFLHISVPDLCYTGANPLFIVTLTHFNLNTVAAIHQTVCCHDPEDILPLPSYS
jgi:hypothetical protein